MFQPNTVFVIGAGASHEFNLPAGEDLKINIADKLDIRFEGGLRQKTGDAEIYDALQFHCKNTKENLTNILWLVIRLKVQCLRRFQ